MSEIEADEDPFDYGFNEQDLEMAVAFEEQWVSSQAPPLFPSLDERPAHLSYRSTLIQAPQAPAQRQHQQRYTQRKSQVQDDAARIIKELQHKLYIQEHENKNLERKLRDSQDVIKIKELEYFNLKRQVQTRSSEQSSSQIAKRVFPQTPPRPKSKIRKTSTPSQGHWSPTSSSSEIANAMESIHLSSQQPSPTIRQPSSMQSPATSTEQYTPYIKSETLSVRSIPFSVSGDQENRSALPLRPPSSANRPNAPKQQLYIPKNPHNLQANLNMLKLLFSDVYKETNKNKSAKLSMMLVPSKILEFARLFCLKFKPADGTCSTYAKEHLTLLASDIQDIIARSENPGFTIPSLLTQFGLCLPICIEEKLHDIIYTISKVLQRLATFSTIAADQLTKEIKFNLANSNVRSLVSALALYNFKKPPCMYHLVEESPEIAQVGSSDVILLAQKYSTMTREIAEAMEYEKTPPRTRETVLCILSLLSVVGAGHSKSTLSFLLTDITFINLLSVDTPIDILDKACAVLLLSVQDKEIVESVLAANEHKPSFFVPQLCSLLSLKQPPNYNHHWYSLCKKVLNLLRLVALLELPGNITFLNKKVILAEIIAFLILCCEFDNNAKRTEHLADHQTLVQSGCRAVLSIVKSSPDIDLLDEDTITKLRNLVIYYVDTNDDDSHPARTHLLGIEKLLDQLEK